jgi:hypothetical protein
MRLGERLGGSWPDRYATGELETKRLLICRETKSLLCFLACLETKSLSTHELQSKSFSASNESL